MIGVRVIDHDRLTRQGIERELERYPGVIVRPGMTFAEALATSQWNGSDVILLDLAESTRFRSPDQSSVVPHAAQTGISSNEAPDEHEGCLLVRHIRRRSQGGPRPAIVVITGQDMSFDNDLVRLRLREEAADGFVHREELERLLPTILAEGSRFRREIEILRKQDLYSYGISERARVGTFVERYRENRVSTLPTEGPGEERRGRIYAKLEATGVQTGRTRKKVRFDNIYHLATRINPWRSSD